MMKKQGPLDDLLEMIFIHPVLPEVARDAAREADRPPVPRAGPVIKVQTTVWKPF